MFGKKKPLTRNEILGSNDIKTEEVDVPEWGGVVLVKAMTGEERDIFEQSMVEGEGKNRRTNLDNLRARLVSRCVVDENGNRVFTDDDARALGKKSAAALDRVNAVAQRLNGLSAEDVEELTKNSETDQSEDSTSN